MATDGAPLALKRAIAAASASLPAGQGGRPGGTWFSFPRILDACPIRCQGASTEETFLRKTQQVITAGSPFTTLTPGLGLLAGRQAFCSPDVAFLQSRLTRAAAVARLEWPRASLSQRIVRPGARDGVLMSLLPARLVASQSPRVLGLGDNQKSIFTSATLRQTKPVPKHPGDWRILAAKQHGRHPCRHPKPPPLLHRNAAPPPRPTCCQPDEGDCGNLDLGSSPPRKPMMTSVSMPVAPPRTTHSAAVVLSNFNASNPQTRQGISQLTLNSLSCRRVTARD